MTRQWNREGTVLSCPAKRIAAVTAIAAVAAITGHEDVRQLVTGIAVAVDVIGGIDAVSSRAAGPALPPAASIGETTLSAQPKKQLFTPSVTVPVLLIAPPLAVPRRTISATTWTIL